MLGCTTLRLENSTLLKIRREDYGLIDIPVHFVGGARDYLIPADNLMVQRDAINLVHPGRSSLRVSVSLPCEHEFVRVTM